MELSCDHLSFFQSHIGQLCLSFPETTIACLSFFDEPPVCPLPSKDPHFGDRGSRKYPSGDPNRRSPTASSTDWATYYAKPTADALKVYTAPCQHERCCHPESHKRSDISRLGFSKAHRVEFQAALSACGDRPFPPDADFSMAGFNLCQPRPAGRSHTTAYRSAILQNPPYQRSNSDWAFS
jgi:hypothetical protein